MIANILTYIILNYISYTVEPLFKVIEIFFKTGLNTCESI